MATTSETIVISGTKEAVKASGRIIDAQSSGQSHVTKRKNLSGDTTTWIMVGALTVKALPHVLAFLNDYLTLKQVKKIKVGDCEVENPSELLPVLWTQS